MTMWDQVTDRQRDVIVGDLVAALAVSGVPYTLQPGLVSYFSDGVLPGGFLQAVLCNDLSQAVMRADPSSEAALPPLVKLLLLHAPALAWGSREAVLAWTVTPDRLEIVAPLRPPSAPEAP